MANLAQSAVSVTEKWREGGTNSRKFKAVSATLTLTGQGTASAGSLIPASLFGMNTIWSVRDAVASTNSLLVATPSYDRSSILIASAANAELLDFPATGFTGTVKLTVLGKD